MDRQNIGGLEGLYSTGFATRVCTIKDVRADVFIARYAKHLKQTGKLDVPKWADYVKTGVAKELAPYDPDWIFVRAASILRHLYMRPNCGVGAFRKIYGSKKRRGAAPGHAKKASGKIVRYILQRFEEMSLVTKNTEKGGRKLTKQGQEMLDNIAKQCK